MLYAKNNKQKISFNRRILMIYKLKNYIIHLRKNLIGFLETIIGEEDDFNTDHRFFNSICLIVSVSFIFRILINLILGIKLVEIAFSHFVTFLSILLILSVSRLSKKLILSRFLFVSVILISFSFNWYYSGGAAGAMPFYYFSLLTIIVFVPIKRLKMSVVCIILVNAALLFILDYRHPHLVLQNLESQKLYIYKNIHLLFVTMVTILIIKVGQRFYWKDQFAITELRKRIKDQLEDDNNNVSEIFHNLTSQERRVLEQIHNGKRNKEIASSLNVDISTVKTHINNIYKKKGVRTRTGMLNILN
jgi:DNA-binding CsgD family transcriptional regulator